MSQPTDVTAVNPYASPAAAPHPAGALPRDGEIRELFNRGKNGAAWFYWIAALSLVNSIMVLAGGGRTFALGLVVTMVADSIAASIALKPGGNMAVLGAALAFDAVVLGLLVLCGRLAQRRFLPVFALGMGVYLLDGLLSLRMGSAVGIGIHAYALWSMASGFAAYRRLNVLEQQMLTAGPAAAGRA
jgi:hypothetical protein